MSTGGSPYFFLDDLEERELWDELRAMTQVRALLPFVLGILCPSQCDDESFLLLWEVMTRSMAKSIFVLHKRDVWTSL
jgi:hypothetical protein